MSGGERRSPRLSWLRWVGLAAVLLLGLRVGLAAVLGRVLDGVVAPHGLALSWDSLSLGLLDLDARLRGLELTRKEASPEEEPLLELEYATLDVDTWLLLQGELRVLRAEVDGLEVTLIRDEDGRWSLGPEIELEELLAGTSDATPPPPEAQEPAPGHDLSLPLDLTAVRLQAARVTLIDRLPEEPVELDLRLNAALSRLGSYRRPTRFSVDLAGGDALYGASLVGTAHASADRLEVDFRSTLGGLQPESFRPYLALIGLEPEAQSIRAEVQGRALVEVLGPSRDGLAYELELRGSQLSTDGVEELALERLSVRLEDRPDSLVVPQPARIEGLHARAGLRADGALQVAGFALLPVPVKVEAPVRPPTPPAEASAPSRLLRLEGVELEGGLLQLLDHSVAPTADLRLACSKLRIGRVELGPGAAEARTSIELDLQAPGIAEGLRIDAALDFHGADRDLLLDLEATELGLDALEPYLRGSGVREELEGVALRLHGEVRTHHAPGEPLHLELDLRELSLEGEEPLLSLGEVVLRDTYYDLETEHLKLGGLLVDGLSTGLRLEPGGELAALGLRYAPSTASPEPAPRSEPPVEGGVEHPLLRWIDLASLRAAIPPVELGLIEVAGTRLVLEDRRTPEARPLTFDDLGLTLEGLVLGLPEGAPAEPSNLHGEVSLEGLLEELVLDGTILPHPGLFDLETRLEVRAQGIDGSSLSPYLEPLGIELLLRNGQLGLQLQARLHEPEPGSWRADAALEQVLLADGETRWLGLDRLALVGARSDGSRLWVDRLEALAPTALVERDADGGLRVAGLRLQPTEVTSESSRQGEPEAPGPLALPDLTGLPPIEVTELQLGGLRLALRDSSTAPPTAHEVTLELGLSDLNTLGDPVGLELSAGLVGVVEALELSSKVQLDEERLDLSGRLAVADLKTDGLRSLLPPGATLVSEDHRLDGRFELELVEVPEGGLAPALRLEQLRWGSPGSEPDLSVERLALAVERFDPAASRLELGQVELEGTRLGVTLEPGGELETLGLRLAHTESPAPPPAAEEPPPVAAEPGGPAAPDRPIPTVVLSTPIELEVEQLTLKDLSAGEEVPPIRLGAGLRVEPGTVLHPLAEEREPLRWSLAASVEGVLEELKLEAKTALFATRPTASLELKATGLSTRALTERVPALGEVARGELEEGELHASLEVLLELQRTRIADLDLSRPFTGTLRLSEARLLDAPEGQVLLGVDEVMVDLGRVDLEQGKLHIEDIEVETPRFAATRDASGVHAAGFLLGSSGSAAGEAEPAAVEATSGTSPEPQGELRIDTLYAGGLDLRFKDDSVSPPFELHIDDLDLDVRGLTSRALTEPHTIRYRAFLASGGERPLFEDLTTRGRVTLHPRLDGWARTELNALELPLLTGYTETSGVELRGGSLRVLSGTKATGGRATVGASLRFEGLEIREESGGPIERALKLPMNLNNALFLTRAPDGSHRLGIDFSLTSGGLSYRELLRQVTGAVALFFAEALAGAPIRLLTTVTPLSAKGPPREPLEVLELDFPPGRTRLPHGEAAELARIGRRLADRPDLRAIVTYEAGAEDGPEAERLANPPDEECLELVRQLRRRRAELWRDIGERKLEARALFAIGSEDALAEVEALRDMERRLADLERGLERVLAVLDGDSARQRTRRARHLLEEIAELRMQEVQLGLQSAMRSYQFKQIERRTIRLREPAEGRSGRVRVELVIP